MNHYFTIEAATPPNVIFGYRGHDQKNTLTLPVPTDDSSIESVRLPDSVTLETAEDHLSKRFASLAVANPGSRILLRLADDNVVTIWIVEAST